ncbi:MAG TPA: presenilin family intramembrane aspartyl protease PSH [Candidatus Thermoplasmatota archaeon]|nr:presenilin family intramembrane aspartyl protease PSH [Candidatus Thermoplasmatota archaeon]
MSEPVDLRRELPALAGMGALYLISIALAMVFSFVFEDQNIRAFEDPTDPLNVAIYLVIVIVFTLVLLAIFRWGAKVIIRYIILGSVLITIWYVAQPLLATFLTGLGEPPFGLGASGVLAAVPALGLTVLLWFYPEWYVINTVGVFVAAGAAGIFGVSVAVPIAILLLAAFAIYDAIAVYRTKHMLDLADSVIELRLPIMFVVPKSRGYSFLEETRKINKENPEPEPGEKREAMFMGLGDAVFPGILVVSALAFLDPNVPAVLGMSAPLVVSLVTLLGSFVGFCILMYFVTKGRPHAGLPLLNGGAIAGFLLALLPIYGVAPLFPWL